MASHRKPKKGKAAKPEKLFIFDTTLRDGNQTDGLNMSVGEKILLSQWLDFQGIAYIEGGYPGANPTDTKFFNNLPVLDQAQMVAFGMTRRRGMTIHNDEAFRAVVDSPAPVVCLVGKAWDDQVLNDLKVSLSGNLDMIGESVAEAKRLKKEVVFDAEHFFDGYKDNPKHALDCLKAAYDAGADWLVLCDTNGKTRTKDIAKIVRKALSKMPKAKFGIHCHNDRDLAVANTLAAVEAGCTMVQGTLGGLGERCGNANLFSLLPTLRFEYGYDLGVPDEKMAHLKDLNDELYELLDRTPNDGAPYVGDNAFAHKGGLHVAAMKRNKKTYQHIDPALVGNRSRFPSGAQSGGASLVQRLKNFGIEVADEEKPLLSELLDSVKRRSDKGYDYEGRKGAGASFAVLAQRKLKRKTNTFKVHKFNTFIEGEQEEDEWSSIIRASVNVQVGETVLHEEALGLGPVHALDKALRSALIKHYPEMKDALKGVRLDDFKVKILNPGQATGATTRVLIDMKDKSTGMHWTTVGVSKNIIEAALEALVDGYNYKLNIGNLALPEPEVPSIFRRSRLDFCATGRAAPKLAA